MKSDEGKLYIKTVELNETYNFVVKFFYLKLYKLSKLLFYFLDFEIQILKLWNDLKC